jgi:hypothetical protein
VVQLKRAAIENGFGYASAHRIESSNMGQMGQILDEWKSLEMLFSP